MERRKSTRSSKSKTPRSRSPTPITQPPKAAKRHLEVKYETKNNGLSSPAPKSPTSDKSHLKKKPRENFQYIIEKIREMRKVRNAPVDMMGAHTSSEENVPEEVRRFQLLIGVLLSCQTQDKNTNQAVSNLKKVKGGFTPENMLKLTEDEILEEIKMVNFNRTKAKNVQKLSKIIIEDFKNKIPETIEELVKLPGIGPKIAVVYLNCASGKTVGIGVDTHVHRISNLLGWVKTEKAEETRIELESFVPREYWDEINVLLIGFGQQICPSRNPKCEECLINDICPEGKRNLRYTKPKGKKVKENEDSNVKAEVKEVKVPESIKGDEANKDEKNTQIEVDVEKTKKTKVQIERSKKKKN